MTETSFAVTEREQEFLVGLLQTALRERRIEEHRTRAPTYREHVIQEGEIILDLLEKLGAPAR